MLKELLVPGRHMVTAGSKVMFLIAASVKRNALVLIIDLYNICIIYNTYLLANKKIGHTVVVIIFSKGDVIIFLHFGNHPDV